MARPTIKTDAVVEEILNRVSAGQTLTAVCALKAMPSIRSLMYWLRDDPDLDEDMHRARIRGTLLQADEAVDTQRKIMAGKVPKGVDARMVQAMVTAANNMGHQANARLTRIDKRFSDKSEVTATGPVVIGWEKPQPAPGSEDTAPAPATKTLEDTEVAGEA